MSWLFSLLDGFRFGQPWALFLLVLPVTILLVRQRRPGVAFSGFSLALQALGRSRRPLLHRALLAAGLVLLIIAAARPQWGRTIKLRTSEGRDLVLAIDLSLSMEVDDMFDAEGRRIDRLRAVMANAHSFIADRPNDRLGLVFFANTALTSCPPTSDHETLYQFLDAIENQQRALWQRAVHHRYKSGLLGNGTNIGLGLGSALRFLARQEDSRGRAIILITDGRDSRELPNWVDPLEAARRAESLDTRIHAIGVGNRDGNRGRKFLPDMARLRDVAETADGIAMHANDREELERVFDRINELEPSPQEVRVRDDYHDRFLPWLLAATVCLVLTWLAEPVLRGRP